MRRGDRPDAPPRPPGRWWIGRGVDRRTASGFGVLSRRPSLHPSRQRHVARVPQVPALHVPPAPDGVGPPGPPPSALAGLVHARIDRFIPARAGNTPCDRASTRGRTVHPRSRGEHAADPDRGPLADGSSPLARGTLCQALRTRRQSRFIPARAGNTRAAETPDSASSVHPRSRGEHQQTKAAVRFVSGSSPLARGTQGGGVVRDPRRRFIPARAGNTRGWGKSRSPRPVHPRSRGEHGIQAIDVDGETGSSPLARGTLVEHLLRQAS